MTSIIPQLGGKVKQVAKVFIVDDDAEVLKSLEVVLTSHGYTPKCFNSAEKFLAHHHPSQVGCVLIDLLMPGIDGGELLRRLQESGSLLSVVVISGWIDTPLLDPHKQTPVPTLEKPYEISTLLQMIEDGVAGSIRRRATLQNRQGRG